MMCESLSAHILGRIYKYGHDLELTFGSIYMYGHDIELTFGRI